MRHPTQEDIEYVEELQLMYRGLRDRPEAEGIGRLCKRVLVVPQVMDRLQGLLGAEGDGREL